MSAHKLDVMATVAEAYRGAWTHFSDMFRLIWLAGALYILISVGTVFLDPKTDTVFFLLLELASLFLWPIVAVTWHRFILLGDEPAGRIHFSFGRREARFLLVTIMLSLFMVPGFLSFMLVGALAQDGQGSQLAGMIAIVGIVLLMAGVFFMVRLSLLLPAVAVDEAVNAGRMLERTKGNFWRLFGVAALSALPFFAALMLFDALPLALKAIGTAIVMLFYAIVNVAVLSIAYRELAGPAGTHAPEPEIDASL